MRILHLDSSHEMRGGQWQVLRLMEGLRRANPAAQFVGSFRWSVTPGVGGITLSLTNTTSFRSLTYDKGPQWPRVPVFTPYGTFTSPMGNTHQTYNVTATCH